MTLSAQSDKLPHTTTDDVVSYHSPGFQPSKILSQCSNEVVAVNDALPVDDGPDRNCMSPYYSTGRRSPVRKLRGLFVLGVGSINLRSTTLNSRRAGSRQKWRRLRRSASRDSWDARCSSPPLAPLYGQSRTTGRSNFVNITSTISHTLIINNYRLDDT
jgi:hypothetical protein